MIAAWIMLGGIALLGMTDPLAANLPITEFTGIEGPKEQLAAIVPAVGIEAVAALLFAFAFWRRVEHNESVYGIRAAAWAVAIGVATMNWTGHAGDGWGQYLFAGASLAAAVLAALLERAKLKDAMRAKGQLGHTPPVYPLSMYWREPRVVRKAKEFAVRDPELGLYGSIDKARTELAAEADRRRTEARHARLRQLVLERLRAALKDDPLGELKAQIAVESQDMNRVITELDAGADPAALARRVASEVAPEILLSRDDQPDAAPAVHSHPVPHVVRRATLPEQPRSALASPGLHPNGSQSAPRAANANGKAVHSAPVKSAPKASSAQVDVQHPPEVEERARAAVKDARAAGATLKDLVKAYVAEVNRSGHNPSERDIEAATGAGRRTIYNAKGELKALTAP